MRQFRAFRWMVVVAVVLIAMPALAGDVLDRIIEKGEIRVGMSGSQPPFNVKSKSGELIGYEVDLANVLASAMRVEPKIVVKPFPELLAALQKGEVDIVMSGMTITPERNTKVAFVGPYAVSGKSILTKSSSLAESDETADINADTITLTALAGSTSQEFIEELIPKATLMATQNYDDAVKMVIEGKADALVADMEICQLTAMRYPEAGLATLSVPLTIEPIGIAMPPSDALFINLVENYLSAVATTGLLDELRARWYDDGSWLIQVP